MITYGYLSSEEQARQIRRRIDSIENCDNLFVDQASRKEDERELFYGSHMDERHSGLSEEDLIKRMLHDRVPASSSYTSEEVAHETVREILYGRVDEIVYFINMDRLDSPTFKGKAMDIRTESIEGKDVKKLSITEEVPPENENEQYAGKGITGDFRFVGTNDSKLVVVKAPMNELGFRILTCIPVLEKGDQLEPRSETLKKVNKVLLNDAELSTLEKTMWLYKEKGYHTSVSRNNNLFVEFQYGKNTFSMMLHPHVTGLEPKVSYVSTDKFGKKTFIPLDKATNNEELKDKIIEKARTIKADIYDKSMNGQMQIVCNEIIKAQQLREDREVQIQNKNNNDEHQVG